MSRNLTKEWFRSAVRRILSRPLTLAIEMAYRRSKPSTPIDTLEIAKRASAPPIDAVYTWVDDSDPVWQKKLNRYRNQTSHRSEESHSTRYHNRDELRFSLRSLAYHAPFIRQVFIVTDGQIPEWLNTANVRVRVVDHQEIFSSPDMLPTFNSHAIEANLHHIDGLAERYIYMNDDVFIGQALTSSDFFSDTGKTVVYLSSNRIPPPSKLGSASTLDVAYYNNSKLIADVFQESIRFKLAHTPHSQLRSVVYEMEERFAAEFEETSRNRFRSARDLSIASCLYQYYAYYSGRGVLKTHGETSLGYINAASPFLAPFLRKALVTRKYRFFCINEPLSTHVDTTRFDKPIAEFLAAYYPQPSDFEVTP